MLLLILTFQYVDVFKDGLNKDKEMFCLGLAYLKQDFLLFVEKLLSKP